MSALVKAALLVSSADGDINKAEYELISEELRCFRVTAEQASVFYQAAKAMPIDDMADLLKSLGMKEQLKISGFLAALIVKDEIIGCEEKDVWEAICTLCEFPVVSIEDSLEYWRNH